MKISAVLDGADLGDLALPEFQRGYVWNREQVRGLMGSLYRRYPVGSLLVWNTIGDTARTRGSLSRAGNTVRLLLDGQQRITSLYGVMRGHPPTFFHGDERAFTGLFFDVRTETFEFYGPVKMRYDPLWIDVTGLFKSGVGPYLGTFSDLGLDPDDSQTYLDRLNRLHTIEQSDLHIEEITDLSMTLDEVVDIFNRLNSSGTKLSKGDLALARICVTWPEARRIMNAKIEEWSEAGFRLTLDWLLRVTNAVLTGESDFKALRDVDRRRFEDALKSSIEHCDRLFALIGDRLGLDHDRVVRGRYAFPVMARLLERSGSLDAADEWRLLYWYLQTAIWGRYSGSTETTLKQDLEAADSGGIDGLIRRLRAWRDLSLTAEHFDITGSNSRLFPLMFLVLRTRGARDLLTGKVLDADGLRSPSSTARIFGRSDLSGFGYRRAQMNAIANLCLVSAGSRREIERRSPWQYLAECERNNPGVLESQLIPAFPQLWNPEHYTQFLLRRREMLALVSNSVLAGLETGVGVSLPVTGTISSGPIELPHVGAWLREIVEMCSTHRLPVPELDYTIDAPGIGEDTVVADAVWPRGIQEGLTAPVAFMLDPDEETLTRLGAFGYRYFTNIEALTSYIESELRIDVVEDARMELSSGQVPESVRTDTEVSPEIHSSGSASGESEVARSKPSAPGPLTPRAEYEIPILEVLEELGGSGSTRDVVARVGEKLAGRFTESDNELRHDGPAWKTRAEWAATNLRRSGALKSDSPRGIWEISESGRARLARSRTDSEVSPETRSSGSASGESEVARSKPSAPGPLTPRAEYEVPILEVLEELGGSGSTREVVARLGEKLADRFTESDTEPRSYGSPWIKRAGWVATRLRRSGDLKGDSPIGIWEISESGRARLAGAERIMRPAGGESEVARSDRLPPGVLLSEGEYEVPILEVLEELGGSGSTQEVVVCVGEKLADRFTESDTEPRSYGLPWIKRAGWVATRLRKSGYLREDSPIGIWEISDSGRARLARSRTDSEVSPEIHSSGPASGESQVARSKPLAPGLLTPLAEYEVPILEVLDELGGSSSTGDVVARVGEKLAGSFTTFDTEPRSYGLPWIKRAGWAGTRLRESGDLKGDSPRGIWEISESGRARLARSRTDSEVVPETHSSGSVSGESEVARPDRLPPGVLLSQAEYEVPILEVLDELGGSGSTQHVVARVGEKLADRLTESDNEKLEHELRWENRTRWARLDLRNSGYLREDSPRGLWEISESGRARLEKARRRSP